MYSTNAINTSDNLLDLNVEEYGQMQHDLPSNRIVNYVDDLLTNSANHINCLDNNIQEDFLGTSSDSELLSIPLHTTESFYSVIKQI